FTGSGLRTRVLTIVSPQRPIAPLVSRTIAAAIVSTLCVLSVGLGGLTLVETTVFALPFVSSRTPRISMDRPFAAATPTSRSDTRADRASRRTTRSVSPPQRPSSDKPSASPPQRPSDQPSPSAKTDTAPKPAAATEATDAGAPTTSAPTNLGHP